MKYTAIIYEYVRHINIDDRPKRRVLSVSRFGAGRQVEVVITGADVLDSVDSVIVVAGDELAMALRTMFP